MYWYIPYTHPKQEMRVPVETRGAVKLLVGVYHPTKKNTVYFDAEPIINGKECIIIKIPFMPKAGVKMEIFNAKNGQIKNDNTFRAGPVAILALRQPFSILKIFNKNTALFADFIDDFAEDAGILDTQPGIYHSSDNRFVMDYVPVIRDEMGRELQTPFRCNLGTKLFQASQKHIKDYTVPERKFWLWHEFGHVYKNVNPASEFEADENGITMYLGTGNPIGAAYSAIFKCFKNTPSRLNRQRYENMKKYLDNFYKTMSKKAC